jgi:hypothetical protein
MELRHALEECQIESPSEEYKFFIPIDVLDFLLTQEAIEKELQTYSITRGRKDLTSYARDIHTKAKKIFAILLCRNKGDSIFSFIEEGIGDKDLPLGRCDPKNAVSLGPNNRVLRLCIYGHPGCGLRSMSVESGWSRQDIKDFCRDQWLVQAPVFQQYQNAAIPHYELEDNVTLPFIEEDKRQMKSGGYSRVWKVKIHAAHQKLYTSNSLNVSNRICRCILFN